MAGKRGKRSVRDLPLDELRAEAERLKDVLGELARRRADPVVGLLSAMEEAVEETKQVFGEEALQRMLDALGPEEGRPKRCPNCGKRARVRVRDRARTVLTLSGSVTLHRHYHYCNGCKHGFYPRDEELGLPKEGSVSRELEKRILDFGLNMPFAEAEERWRVHYALPLSSNLVRRVVDRVGSMAESCHDAALQQSTRAGPRKAPRPLIVQVDGSHIPTRDRDWKEAKLGVLVPGECYLPGRGGARGVISAARYVGVLGPQSEFADCLDIAIRMERSGSGAHVAWIGDGAPGNWRLAERLAPKCTQILDWHHAMEHAATCAKTLFGEGSPWVDIWLRSVAERLRIGGVNELLTELEQCRFLAGGSRRDAIRDLRRYFRTNRKRMAYDEYLARGLPIGSGIVESGHRHVLQRRMKNAGQRWSHRRARRMVRLRCAYQTAGPERFHAAVLQAHAMTLTGEIPRVGWQKRRASNA